MEGKDTMLTPAIVDPDTDTIRVHRRAVDGRLSDVSTIDSSGEAAVTTPLVPSLSLPLTELFARD